MRPDPRHPSGHRRARLGATVLALVLVAGCARGAPAPDPSPSASPAPSAPTAEEVRAAAEAGTAAGTVAIVAVPPTVTTAEPPEEGSGHVTLAPTTPGAPAARLAGPEGTAWHVLPDGSAVLRDASAVALGGVNPTGGVGLRDDAGVLTASGPTTPADDGSPGLWLASRALAAAEWGEREGGRSLAVTPTAWARSGSAAARELLWAQLVAAEPEADTPSMHDQLLCHVLGAPDKDTWNLEPWRPEVDDLEMLRTRCNPT